MLLYQNDNLVIEFQKVWEITKNKNEDIQQLYFTICIQINWKLKRSNLIIFASKNNETDISNRELMNYNEVLNVFQVLKDFGYEIWDWKSRIELMNEYLTTLPN